ncbi:MAG: histidine triad nucleotide-binding protein [Oscillospiraceae bacterium]|nr:histidine triad nucleotide-binding protein [Oscillospiraceae bacterium]
MPDCIFCKIIAGEIPCKKVYEDELVLAFHDINPQAPVHILIIPKRHLPGAAELAPENSAAAARCLEAAAQIAKEQGLESFRVVTNNGKGAGQTVFHLHFHLLAGRDLTLQLA